jgi:hypothetical protein
MSLVRILVASLKAILPLHEHCIGAGESNMSTYKIKHAKLPIAQPMAFFIKLSISWLLPVCSSIVLMNTACQINTCSLWWIEMFGLW